MTKYHFSRRFDVREYTASEAIHFAEYCMGQGLCIDPEEFRSSEWDYEVSIRFVSEKLMEVVIKVKLLDLDDIGF